MSETAALLPGADDDSDDTDNATTMPHHPRRRLSPGARPKPPPPLPASSSPHSPRRAVRPLLLLVALVNLAWSLYQLPVSRIVESRLCREYYAEHDPSVLRPEDGSVPEERCKIEGVQQPLGWMLGVVEAGWVAGDFIMTIPLVCLADHFGHRFVLCLNLIPRVFLLAWSFAVGYFDRVLPVKAILAAPMLSFLGGDCVFNSIVYALVSDLTEDHVLRATLFGYVNAISSIFSLQLGPALASATMSVLLWLPPLLGIGLLAFAVLVTAAVPLPQAEVSHQQQQVDPVSLSTGTPESSQSYGDGEDVYADIEAHLIPASNPATPTKITKPSLKTHTLTRLRTLLTLLRNPSRNLALLLTVFFLASLASSDTKLLPLYISTQYAGWRLADVGYLLSAKAVFNFGLLWFVVPRVLRWRRGRRLVGGFGLGVSQVGAAGPAMREREREGGREGEEGEGETVENAVVCLVFSVLGAVLIGISPRVWVLLPSLLVYALGIALPMFTYSLLKAPSMGPAVRVGGEGSSGNEDMGTQLFSVVMLVRTVGTLVGTVVMPALWVTGLGVGGWALGLPFLVSAGGYAVAVLVVKKIDV